MGRLIWFHQILGVQLILLHFQVCSSLTLPSSSLNSAPLCLPEESSALLQFKSILSLDSNYPSYSCDPTSSPKTNSWNESTNCCLWEGVTCDKVTARVIALDLSCSWLIGSLPANNSLFLPHRLQQLKLAQNNLNGSIPSSLFSRLVSLTHLDLSYNRFSGSISSALFGHLVSLTHLNLSSNQFSSVVPSEISLLSQLVSLDLSQFHPDYRLTLDKHSFDLLATNSTKLTILVLDGLDMSGVPPSSLLNLSSSLKHSSLGLSDLNGELPSDFFRFPYLQYLDISGNNDITGYLPESNWSSPLELLDLSYCNFRGSLPASLGALTKISIIDLSENSFGGKIPDVFGSLEKISTLKLFSSNFSGQLPPTIFNLTKITHLDLSKNSLQGELPAHISGLQNLEELDLSYNLISGGVPSWLFALPSLNVLDLSNNKLLTLPTDDQIQKPNSVQRINLGSNDIHGSVPSFSFDLVNLTDLDLSSNNLSGVITSEMLSKPKRLQSLSLSNNSLLSLISSDSGFNYSFQELGTLSLSSCNIRRFPSFLRTGKKLNYLDLSNNKMEGSISEWESEGWEQLTYLNLSYNSLTSLQQYPGQNLAHLDISSNRLHGPLLAPPPSLQQFLISNNNLTGEVPTLICNLSSLQNLDLSMNNLGGMIPACLGNSSEFLYNINLQMNNFHGQIPAFVSDKLLSLALNDNQLQGLLPRSLVSCSALRFLNVANNKINDTFPHWLGILPELQVLVLRSNRFHGPLENATVPSPFSSLKIIDLSHNEFTGTLLTNFFQDLTAMKFGNRTWTCAFTSRLARPCNFDNRDSVKVGIKRLQLELQLGGTLPDFTIIDFSNNQFYGRIPEVLGELGSLLVLNLSYNQLTGPIPPLLGHMEALESLDLSSNKLEGRIPPELTNLTFLGVLNLSQNNLVGPIPQGQQFNTFENDSYKGNPGLWGCPLSKKCRSIPEPPPSIFADQDDDDSGISFNWKVAMMGYGCGTVLGMSMGYILFSTGRPRWFVRKIDRDWKKNVSNWVRRFGGRRN